MKTLICTLAFCAFFFSQSTAQPLPAHNLTFETIPMRWDRALPLGNALLGALVWQKEGHLRLSLDRADLWDLRPMKGLDRPEFTYRWVAEQVAKGEYDIVQDYFDAPYEREPAPSKLPGAALEWNSSGMDFSGKAQVQLDIATGLATIALPNGVVFKTFVHAKRPEGWFRLEMPTGRALPTDLMPNIIAPPYQGDREKAAGGSVAGDDLARLGYVQSTVERKGNSLVYHQPCWGGFSYQTAVAWRISKGALEGVWSISSHFPERMYADRAEKVVKNALSRGFTRSFAQSKKWWAAYWQKSSIRLPDPLLEKQYYLDNYKFGCLARAHTPMISLQGIWTADNGRLPPWKGDLHHDLNTEMSYWHAYAANHGDLAEGYLRHLLSNETAHRNWTKAYFGTSGLNVPGVETLLGAPMGGWIQYACSPTTSSWLAQHFYWHWRYSGDKRALKDDVYPFFEAVATHLDELTKQVIGARKAMGFGFRVLPLSSSPEINDNSINAWFPNTWTNYDLALARFVFEKAAEMATTLGKTAEAQHWNEILGLLPPLALTEKDELKFAPTLPYNQSHRHFSHLMSIYPLGLLKWENGAKDQQIIQQSLQQLAQFGSAAWTGYSFGWQCNLLARAHDGAGAYQALRTFAKAFVSPNSFHLNGDQTDQGFSGMKYDPFTLEGNFAFAAGVQEMLLQGHGKNVEVFPALPTEWKDVSFQNLRAEGAFLISADKTAGKCGAIAVTAEQGGTLRLTLPAGKWRLVESSKMKEMPLEAAMEGTAVFLFKKNGKLKLVAM